MSIRFTTLVFIVSAFAWAQEPPPPPAQDQNDRHLQQRGDRAVQHQRDVRDVPQQDQSRKPSTGAVHDIGSGAGKIGVGAAHGAGDLAWGTAKGVGSLATLHPIDAGLNVGKGAVGAAKDVSVGAAKGGAKIGKGIFKAFRKI